MKLQNPTYVLLETKNWFVMLSPDQGYLGRSYITLKSHKEHLAQLTKQEWDEFSEVVKRLENAVQNSLNADLFNWTCLMNNAYQESPAHPHVHWHFRPRYKNDQTIDEVIFKDPMFGYPYNGEQKLYPKESVLNDIKNQIIAAL